LLFDKEKLESKAGFAAQMRVFNHELDSRSQIKYSHSEERYFDSKPFIIFIYTLSEIGQKIMDKISKGAYSELPSWYKNQWFQESMNIKDRFDLARKHRVVFKSSLLKKMIEEDLIVKLDDSTELESKPILQEEILDHPFELLQEEIDMKKTEKEVNEIIRKARTMPLSEKFKDLYEKEALLKERVEAIAAKRKQKEDKALEKKATQITINNDELI